MEKEKEVKKTKQTMHYVAFMDVLGYKSYFEKDMDATENFLTTIKEAIEDCKRNATTEREIMGWTMPFQPQIKLFSDNILLYIPYDSTNFMPFLVLLQIISNVQYRFITKYNLFLRGGVAKELFYADENIAFGKALINAYTMESKKANYPKIIIDKEAVSEYINYNKTKKPEFLTTLNIEQYLSSLTQNIARDTDGSYFVNYISSLQFFEYIEEDFSMHSMFKLSFKFSNDKDSVDLKYKRQLLQEHKKALLIKIKDFGNYDDISNKNEYSTSDIQERFKIMIRYMWSVDYHNKSCEFAGVWKYKIKYKMSMDATTHLPKVEVIENDE